MTPFLTPGKFCWKFKPQPPTQHLWGGKPSILQVSYFLQGFLECEPLWPLDLLLKDSLGERGRNWKHLRHFERFTGLEFVQFLQYHEVCSSCREVNCPPSREWCSLDGERGRLPEKLRFVSDTCLCSSQKGNL